MESHFPDSLSTLNNSNVLIMRSTLLVRGDGRTKPEALRRGAPGALEDLIGETMLYLHMAGRRHGLTLVQLVALRLVDREGPMSPSVLADHLGISRPAATSSIDVLEAGGWIVRSRPAGDRRTLQTALTSRGHGVLEEVARERRSFLEEGLSVLDRRDRAELLRLTSRVVDGLRAMHPVEAPAHRRPE